MYPEAKACVSVYVHRYLDELGHPKSHILNVQKKHVKVSRDP